jgi:hypothetical protein
MGIFWTKQRQLILEEENIPFTVDVYLRFVFPNEEAERQAIKRLKPKHKK